MRIVYIAAGAGNMYCGACARDLTLIRELFARGHDVTTYPLYMPLRMDGDPISTRPVALGGINVYLQQASPFFRWLPAAFTRWLDAPWLLQWVSRFAVSSQGKDLGPLTVSVLEGRDGAMQGELGRLLDMLAADTPPDVVNITNSLLSGIAPAVKAKLGVPVVCNIQGEEHFVAALPPPFATRARDLIRANAAAIDLFLAPSDAYAVTMGDYLGVPSAKMRTAHPGVDVGAFCPATTPRLAPPVIGYLSVILPGKGLDLLVEATARLVAQGHDVRLRIAGRPLDAAYWRTVNRRIDALGLRTRVESLGEIDFAAKIDFLRGCTAFAVPSRAPESRGIAMLEAMACGIPTVLPAQGIFPELHSHTGAGLLCPPNDVAALTEALGTILADPAAAHARARAAVPALASAYAAQRMADDVLAVLADLIPAVR